MMWALVSIALAGASFAPKASAQATTETTVENEPFETDALNPCNGQDVTFSGVLHAVDTVISSASGNVMANQHLDWSNVKATDPLGTPT
jgi:hypothetical protein